MSQEHPELQKGREARCMGYSKNECPWSNLNMLEKHWWLAGWHDKDMELV